MFLMCVCNISYKKNSYMNSIGWSKFDIVLSLTYYKP